jgi:hypothetical protein
MYYKSTNLIFLNEYLFTTILGSFGTDLILDFGIKNKENRI